MISNDSNRSLGCSGWLKGLFGAAVALIAAGGSMVAILDYFQVEPGPHNRGNLAIVITSTQEVLPVQETAEQTDQPTVTVSPTATILPTETSTPTRLPRPDAVEFVTSYWQNISDHHFESAWAQLSPQFRQNFHNNSYEDYLQGYQKMNVCRIDVSNANLIRQNDFSAVVTAHFIYYTGAQCSSSQYDFEMWLIYHPGSNSWQFDKNIIRR